jgi:anti-sigma factor RsiW
MNSDTQLKVQAYLDNELSPGEARKIAAILSSDRDAQNLYTHLRATKELLTANEPEVKLDESREFYWSKLQRQLERAEREPARHSAPLWVRLLAPLAGTAALAILLFSVISPGTQIVKRTGDELASRPIHGDVQDLAPDMSSVTFRSDEQGVTVVWLSEKE